MANPENRLSQRAMNSDTRELVYEFRAHFIRDADPTGLTIKFSDIHTKDEHSISFGSGKIDYEVILGNHQMYQMIEATSIEWEGENARTIEYQQITDDNEKADVHHVNTQKAIDGAFHLIRLLNASRNVQTIFRR